MPRMGVVDQLRGLFRSPPSPEAPRFEQQRWTNPIGFAMGVTVPPEISGLSSIDGLTEPKISRAQAMQVPAVKRVRDLIAGTLGTLQPRMIDSNNRVVYSELLDQPEEDIARSITMTRLIEDMLFEEHGWWRITEFDANGYPAHVVRLEPRSVSVREEGKVYVNSVTGQPQGTSWRFVPDSELIRFDCPSDGLLTAGAAAIRQALLLGRAASRYAKDPMPLGFFTPLEDGVGPGDQKEVDAALDHFSDQMQKRAWGYMDGMKAQTLSWSPEQMALTAQRDQAVLEIARLGGVDPEELGVSTTTRTYQNSEQRRLDLIDFTLIMYAVAIEDRLKMNDVSPPGHRGIYDYGGFLRSDTLSRLAAYKAGVELGIYTPERIAEIERIPVDSVRKALAVLRTQTPAAAPRRIPAQTGQTPQVETTMDTSTAVGFSSAKDEGVSLSFSGEVPEEFAFKASESKREVSGLLLPYGQVAWSGGYRWEFAPGSLHWAALGRVKLDDDHKNGTEFGVASLLDSQSIGYFGKFKIARGPKGDEMLGLAADGVRDGFSVYVDFSGEGDGYTEHPTKPGVRLVHSATLRKVALTAIPSFDDARVTTVAASRGKDTTVTAPTDTSQGTGTGTPAAVQFDAAAFAAAFAPAMAPVMEALIKPLIEALPAPQRETVKAGAGLQGVVEPPVYRMNGHGASFVRDTWKARTQGDHEAADRLRKFMAQTEEASVRAMDLGFAINTGNASGVIPPGYRPDLFVTQLMKGRPLVNSVSRGTLSDATPFNIPAYVSSTGETATHVEGVNPTGGTMVLGTKTVSPTAISGKFELTREIVDSANPAIDAIAMAAMRESYSQQTEALVYAEINGASGVGGTITANKVPSGAAARAVTGSAGGAGAGGDELLSAVREAEADFWFDRFGEMDRAHISREATQAYAGAKDSSGRPLLPYVGPQNAVGTSNPNVKGYLVDGVVHQPTWSMTGNAAGDADVVMFSQEDIWAWESGLLMFRYEERNGPAQIDLALFGYFATRILRPQGFTAIRFTVTP